ncbi:MAG: MnmC family methyltransferase [Pseudomonadota bacterium]|nr:MnmC family methyltransferase [Pseudomonadota bacterium]
MPDNIITGDGSRTLYCESVGEHYHSTKDGAFSESLHKHVLPAWKYRIDGRKKITVLDLCFGLGYNTFALTWYLSRQKYTGHLRIISPEHDEALLSSLIDFSYPDEFCGLGPIIRAVAENRCYESSGLSIEIFTVDARSWLTEFAGPVDIVFHDPFSPTHNHQLWTREYFAELKRVGASDLLVTTYSTATAVRMGLFENGFHIYENRPEALVRSATLASPASLPLAEIDMQLKQLRNPAAASLRDN